MWAQIWLPQYLPPYLSFSLAEGQCPLHFLSFSFPLWLHSALSLAGWSTFLWAQVTNKETESARDMPAAWRTESFQSFSLHFSDWPCSFARHSPLWVAALCHSHCQLPGPASLKRRVTFRTNECLGSEILSAPCSDQQGRGLLCSDTST